MSCQEFAQAIGVGSVLFSASFLVTYCALSDFVAWRERKAAKRSRK